jgi:phospholipase A1
VVAAPAVAAPKSALGRDVFEAGATYADRWELDDAHQRGKFLIRPYKPVYVLPVVFSNKINRTPQSPTQSLPAGATLPLDDIESKFQLSLKTKLASGLINGHGDLWGAYTQSSRWQVYNGENSRPFRETNYEPEIMAIFGTDYPFLGLRGKLLGLSLNHQSNGRADPLSRSWNRVIGMAGFEQGDWSLMVRPWWRIPEKLAVDNNPDIGDYLGRAEAVLTRRWGEQIVSLQMRHSLRSGSNSRGSAELEWAFPISGNLRGQVQLFHGYGESLIDYNWTQTRLGLGVSLVEWR